jgi:hypothetical protein
MPQGRGSAKRFNKRIRLLNEQGKRAICMAFIGRGGDNPNLGITLRIPYEGEILQGKRQLTRSGSFGASPASRSQNPLPGDPCH